MANKVMEAKANKLKRMKRAWNRYGNIRSGAVPSRVVLDQYKMSARGLDGTSELLAEKIALGFKNIPPGKVEALKRQGELEAKLPDGCDLTFRGPGPWNSLQRSFVYFNSRRDQFLIVHHDLKKMIVRRSIVYASLEIATIRWNADKVIWISYEELPRG